MPIDWNTVIVGTTLCLAHLALGIVLGTLYLRRRSAAFDDHRQRNSRIVLEKLRGLSETVLSVGGVNAPRVESKNYIGDHLVEVVDQVVAANASLHEQLSVAELQLQQQAAVVEKHVSQSLTDPLTQLPNRRALDEVLGCHGALRQRCGTPLSLVLVDADHFKQLNDRFGHTAGDAVLRQLAFVLRDSLRESDCVARYGGEEFAVVLPATSLTGALTLVQHLTAMVASTEFRFEGKTLPVTISAGLAELASGEQCVDLIARADTALYAAKSGGRNCGWLHDGEKTRLVHSKSTNSPATEPPRPSEHHDAVSVEDCLAKVSNQLRLRVAELSAAE